jgi:AbrB family looped-hinge helix DNA binding protein
MKAKLDAESRIVIPSNIRDELDIKPNDEVIVEKIDDKVIISKPLSPEEFLEEARILAEDIRRTKIREIDPLKIKKMWEG